MSTAIPPNAKVGLAALLVKAGSADVAFALIDADIVYFEVFRIDHGGVNFADPAGILEEGEEDEHFFRRRRADVFLHADVITVPGDASFFPFHGPDVKVLCGVKVIVVQVMAVFREMDVEVNVIAAGGVVSSLQFDDINFEGAGLQVLGLAFRGVFLLGRIALMQPEGAEQSTAAWAAGADFEPAVFLGEFFHDLEGFCGCTEAMVRGRDAADAGMRRFGAERQPVVNAELQDAVFNDEMGVVVNPAAGEADAAEVFFASGAVCRVPVHVIELGAVEVIRKGQFPAWFDGWGLLC